MVWNPFSTSPTRSWSICLINDPARVTTLPDEKREHNLSVMVTKLIAYADNAA